MLAASPGGHTMEFVCGEGRALGTLRKPEICTLAAKPANRLVCLAATACHASPLFPPHSEEMCLL